MPDIFNKEKRSWVMSRIKSANTSIDKAMGLMLKDIGVKFESYPKMFGNPDFSIPSKKIAIFCDGDFWHGYNYLRRGKKPSSPYWAEKIARNVKRDKEVTRKLRADGWTVLRFWEHDILAHGQICIKKIRTALNSL
jgi:DNA mismatch endonuclease (patch repair protein)